MALDIQAGDHVGIWSTNRPEWVQVQFATASIGTPLVNINPAYRSHELEYVLRQADITTLVLLDRFKSSHYLEILKKICPELEVCAPGSLESARLPNLKRVIGITESVTPGVLLWRDFLAQSGSVSTKALKLRRDHTQPADVVNIQYTSGTTGFPKGVQLTHRNLLMNAFHVGQRMELCPDDRLCVPVPFYHCFGCVLGTLVSFLHGTSMVVPAEAFDIKATLRSIAEERCTAIYGVPAMFIAELNEPSFQEFDLTSLRTGIMAGSPCPVEVMQRVVIEMNAEEITIAYGLTEASPVVTQTWPHDTIEHRVKTIGTPLPGLDVKIIDPETGNELPPGQQGELVVKGHGVMKGYYKLPEETARAITPDHWLHTGDLGTRSEDGYFNITGRIKDMIIRGGENIYPREIEEYLFNMPQIQNVQVIGLPDKKFGEVVSAWIILKKGHKLTEEQVKDFCRDSISYFKIPHYVVFVDAYPMTITGKTQKYKLRKMGIQRFGLDKEAETETA